MNHFFKKDSMKISLSLAICTDSTNCDANSDSKEGAQIENLFKI